MPPIMLKRVLLPLPVCPTKLIKSPWLISKLISLQASNLFTPKENVLEILIIFIFIAFLSNLHKGLFLEVQN